MTDSTVAAALREPPNHKHRGEPYCLMCRVFAERSVASAREDERKIDAGIVVCACYDVLKLLERMARRAKDMQVTTTAMVLAVEIDRAMESHARCIQQARSAARLAGRIEQAEKMHDPGCCCDSAAQQIDIRCQFERDRLRREAAVNP